MNKIYSLLAQDGKLKKIYEEYKKDISVGKYFEPTEHKIEGLHHLHFILNELRRRKEDYCFIRGNPNSTRLFGTNSWRRVKHEQEGCFTVDEPKNWAMFDIDDLKMRDDEDHNFETLRKRLAEEIDFIEEDTEMIIDFSSSAQLSRKGEKHERLWKAHIYVWFEEKITCNDLHARLGNYEGLIDRATAISQQIHFFEEPIIDKTYWNCDITERTRYFEGKNCKLPSLSRLAPLCSLASETTLRGDVQFDSSQHEKALFRATQGIEGRYLATWQYFCYVVNTNRNRDYAIKKVWEGTNRWQGFKTKEDVEKKMQEAWNYCTKKYLPNLNIGRHKLIELQTDNITKQIYEIVRGVMMIKSPQSTYKTQLLKRIPKNASVLFITHRISLSQDICNQLQLFNYLDASCQEELLEKHRLGITHHSLHRLMNTNKGYGMAHILDGISFDYVILDESEQFLSDIMFNDLFNDKPFDNHDVFNYVGQFVQRAKTVYVADADLSDLSKLFLEIWRTDDEKFNIYQNDYRLGGKTVYGMQSQDALLEKVYDDLRNKKRIYITCERKDAPKEQYDNIKKKFPNANIIWINGDTPKSKYRKLFDNPNKELPLLFNGQSKINKGEFVGKKLDVVIVNSVMSTGFSIGRKDDMDNRFHSVYGIFDNSHMIYTGSDMRQALRRVRNADRYYAFISKQRMYVRNIDEILDKVYGEHISEMTFQGLKKTKTRQKAISKFNRKLNFIAHLEDCGWNYKESDDIANFREYYKRMQEVKKEKELELINARKLSDKDFYDVLHSSHLDDELAKKKYLIEKSFDSPITNKTIKRYRNGDIEKLHQVRDKLKEDIKDIAKREGSEDVFLVESLRRLFSYFGLDFEKMNESAKEINLWAYQIDDEVMKWLFDKGNANAISFLLGEKYGLSLSATNYKGLDEDKLRFFVKIAKFFDFDCKLQDKNLSAEEEGRGRVTFAVLKKHMKAFIKKAKKESTRTKRDLSPQTKELIKRFGGEDFSANVEEYIENLKVAISENKNPRKLEIEFLKDHESYIVFRSYIKPQYTRFLSKFISRYINDIDCFEPTTNFYHEKTQPPIEDIEDFENVL